MQMPFNKVKSLYKFTKITNTKIGICVTNERFYTRTAAGEKRGNFWAPSLLRLLGYMKEERPPGLVKAGHPPVPVARVPSPRVHNPRITFHSSSGPLLRKFEF